MRRGNALRSITTRPWKLEKRQNYLLRTVSRTSTRTEKCNRFYCAHIDSRGSDFVPSFHSDSLSQSVYQHRKSINTENKAKGALIARAESSNLVNQGGPYRIHRKRKVDTSFGVARMECIYINLFDSLENCLMLLISVVVTKSLKQGYRFHKLGSVFSKFCRRHRWWVEKYNVSLKKHLQQHISEPEFYGTSLMQIPSAHARNR